jgi:predicted DNA-binding transcriptional regulator AlpA
MSTTTSLPEPPALPPVAVAAMLGISVRTLLRRRQAGDGPPWYRVGPRLVRYDQAALQAYRMQAGGSQAGQNGHGGAL